jgi:membrane-associated HD superfamily phosphohydrolase
MCSLLTRQRLVTFAAVAAALLVAAQPEPFTMLLAMGLMIPAAYLFITVSSLLLGRGGLIASTTASLLMFAVVLIFPLIR